MNIETYLEKRLSGIPMYRLKVRAEIELRRLMEDHIICQWDCHYIRNESGDRNGIRYLYRVEKTDKHVKTVDIVDAKTSEKHTLR